MKLMGEVASKGQCRLAEGLARGCWRNRWMKLPPISRAGIVALDNWKGDGDDRRSSIEECRARLRV